MCTNEDAKMSSEPDLSEYLEQDIVGLVLQYLKEKGFQETAHLYVLDTSFSRP